MTLRDLLPPSARKALYQALAFTNAVLAILLVVPFVPFDVPAAIVIVAAIANAAGFPLAAGNTNPPPAQD
jgi:hypothetical protein